MKSEQDLREHVLTKATADEGFRERLVADPRGTVEQECGIQFPDGYRLEVHEDERDHDAHGSAGIGEAQRTRAGSRGWRYRDSYMVARGKTER